MRTWLAGLGTIGAAMLAALLTAGAAPPPPEPPIEPALLVAREHAWRAWFGGDAVALTELLPPEFIGISWTDGPLASREATIAASTAFKKGGGRLLRLAFPETRAQRFGDTVVLYGRFEAVLDTGGREQTIRGRLTETFVRRGGRWLHPGWHLDASAAPETSPGQR